MRSGSKNRSGSASSPPPPKPHEPRHWSPLLLLLPLSAVLFVLAGQPFHFDEDVLLLDPPATALLAPDDAWTPPVAQLASRGALGQWPYWLHALSAAGLLGFVATRLRHSQGMFGAALFLVGTSLSVRPLDVVAASLLAVATALAFGASITRRGRLAWATLAACLVLAIATTIEFGLMLIPAAVAALRTGLSEVRRQDALPGRRRFVAATMAVACVPVAIAALISAIAPQLLQAGLRPWTGIWIQPPPELLSKTSFLLTSDREWLPALLLFLWFAWWWIDRLHDGSTSAAVLLAALPLSLVGVGCSRYGVICACGLAMIPRSSGGLPISASGRQEGLILLGLLVIGAVSLLIGPNAVPGVRFSPLPRLVDPTRFGTSGTVVLTNLDRTSQWQTARNRQRFQLLIDDRWDLFGDKYRDHARFCCDLTELRDSSYILSDGSWGGYRQDTNGVSPVLLVVDSADVAAIRQLSLNPDWSLQSIDGERTIFGNRQIATNVVQQQRAAAMLTELEWPRTRSISLDPAVIISHDIGDDRRVSAVLSAIRLPYASLRLLPSDNSWQTRCCRAWCLLDLAHRVRRHSGVSSLLDQYRALALVRAGLADSRFTPAVQRRICRSLQGLEVPPDRLDLLTCEEAASDVAPAAAPGTATDEDRVRESLRAGDSQAARERIGALDTAVRRYYETLVAADRLEPTDLLAELSAAVQDAAFPARLAGEAWFYVGCLAIEAGQPELAAEALQRSRQAEPESPFGHIRQFYHQQLTRR